MATLRSSYGFLSTCPVVLLTERHCFVCFPAAGYGCDQDTEAYLCAASIVFWCSYQSISRISEEHFSCSVPGLLESLVLDLLVDPMYDNL